MRAGAGGACITRETLERDAGSYEAETEPNARTRSTLASTHPGALEGRIPALFRPEELRQSRKTAGWARHSRARAFGAKVVYCPQGSHKLRPGAAGRTNDLFSEIGYTVELEGGNRNEQ
jgi:hypothetical protein